MPQLVDGNNQQIRLGREIARAGEGIIYAVVSNPTQAAKLYHGGLPPREPEKLSWMARNATENLLRHAAWPISTLHHERADSPAVGFLMPRIADCREIHMLYRPEDRLRYFPGTDWRFLCQVAANCTTSFAAIHERGAVVGDVNERGVTR